MQLGPEERRSLVMPRRGERAVRSRPICQDSREEEDLVDEAATNTGMVSESVKGWLRPNRRTRVSIVDDATECECDQYDGGVDDNKAPPATKSYGLASNRQPLELDASDGWPVMNLEVALPTTARTTSTPHSSASVLQPASDQLVAQRVDRVTLPRQSRDNYRGDVDGLRALAVIAVIVYHLDKRWLPGGVRCCEFNQMPRSENTPLVPRPSS